MKINNQVYIYCQDQGRTIRYASNVASFFVLKQQPKIICKKTCCLCPCSNCKNYYPEQLIIETNPHTTTL